MGEVKSESSTIIKRSLVIPCATVFISSFCIMVLELVAGRIIARFLGSSLYTWTSVIGVVLAGITIGNYFGGRLADKFKPVKIIPVLFGVCALACLITIVINNLMGSFTFLWQFNWPTRILLHVTAVFLLPSALLGTISPVVAKMALEKGLPTGRTVGDIYAWGAAGSIAGTFAAGYYLIAMMGTISIIWAIAGVMIAMALLYGAGLWSVRAVAAILIISIVLTAFPSSQTKQIAYLIGLKSKPVGIALYEKGDFTAAVENFKKTVELEPANPENSMNLIAALQAGGKIDLAVEAAQNAIEYFSKMPKTSGISSVS